MIEDILQALIYKKTDHFSCNNCEMCCCMNYANNNKICSGIVKNINPELPYDVIRVCISQYPGIEPYDYTPDEALSLITVLSHSLGDWVNGTKAYQKFRTQKDASTSPL